MEKRPQLSGVNLFFLWFGAAVSVAEILAGGFLADLGLVRGLWAIVLGHAVGVALLVLAGLIGFNEKLPAIMSTRISFGRQGSYLISAINILQLIGWTAIMIVEGGVAMNAIAKALWQFNHPAAMMIGIGVLIGLWVFWDVEGFRYINTIAAVFLLGLTVVMSFVLLTRPDIAAATASRSPGLFGMGFELAVIMPLSWVPLISDYTSLAPSRRAAVAGPLIGYFIGSCWMYAIGLVGAIYAGTSDPTGVMLAANLGLAALAILVLSTVTTTFLDVFSAGVSLLNIFPRLSRRWVAVLFTVLGTGLALVFPIDRYTDFLYVLGSVFSPLVAVLLCDYFLLKRDNRERRADLAATISLLVGIGFYYLIKPFPIPVGPTLTTIAFTALLHLSVRTVFRRV
ncbi:MAG: putative hydroxymethylpyrimidine transporter CytX [Syntrophales bacterium]|jgi:putative hydroxymethylpyrimidine transporter CytX|nr:putative hydroxymethylpyrimidine transporter CytX [Syntrophales bacterium]MDD4340191.1 putative hydroxymethylpyrimidine transporter CytX [Syntrophales bacterium]HOG08325.1 putative hydroxymethylpyrimidine transporter CytX [Syntrophales bacterium]HOS78503.1 putative hydroxymethylpyrimidine transporter CytX [Syntrophales bacterium]HPB71278.1 putative hydroxymethylpyrimidine transporter CytX [Syntrophales bacterium]